MRVLKVVGIFLFVLTLTAMGMAGTNSMGIRDVSHVTFVAPMHVGTVVLPAGDYVVRHTMEGQTHVMIFQRAQSKDEFQGDMHAGSAVAEGARERDDLRVECGK